MVLLFPSFSFPVTIQIKEMRNRYERWNSDDECFPTYILTACVLVSIRPFCSSPVWITRWNPMRHLLAALAKGKDQFGWSQKELDKGKKYIQEDQMLQTWGGDEQDFETQNYLSCHNRKSAHRIHSPQWRQCSGDSSSHRFSMNQKDNGSALSATLFPNLNY